VIDTTLLIKEYLRKLRLSTMARELERILRDAVESSLTYDKFLLALLEMEIAQREENALKTRLSRAKFPLFKTLDTFDFSALPSAPKQKVLQLARGEFLRNSENLIFVGNSGTGKTHLAIAIGISLCRMGKSVRFFKVADLVNLLLEAQATLSLPKFHAQMERMNMIILDELGYVSLPKGSSELLFTFCASLYERRSLCITTNLEFSAWPEVFGDPRMTAALIDRLTHRAHILVMNGESYRFRQSAKKAKNNSRAKTPPEDDLAVGEVQMILEPEQDEGKEDKLVKA
jgi:DNA replication protein DnaC